MKLIDKEEVKERVKRDRVIQAALNDITVLVERAEADTAIDRAIELTIKEIETQRKRNISKLNKLKRSKPVKKWLEEKMNRCFGMKDAELQ